MDASAKRFLVRNGEGQYLTTDGIFVEDIKDPKVDVRNVHEACNFFASVKERIESYAVDYGLNPEELKLFCFNYNEMYNFRCCSLGSKEYPEDRSDIHLLREW